MNRQFFENILPGTLLFSRFALVRCISAGEKGGVYLVQDTRRRNRLAAIKILSAGSHEDDTISSQLYRELRLSRCINHPNILRGEEFFRDGDFVAYTMEFMDGGSLADHLERKRQFSTQSTVKILSQLCDGLQAIHEGGIIHRDLKPENVLLSGNDDLRIADFGISTPIDAADASLQESITGTLNYLSPEYVAEGRYDVRSDIYSLGIIAYELTTGHLPFEGGSLLDTLTARVRYDPSPPHVAARFVPRPLSHAIMKAIERNPARRFQQLSEFREAIDFMRLPNGLPLWALEPAPLTRAI